MIRVVRLGSPRASGEGLRLGTVRRPPRGVKKSEFARRDYYDVWLPDLSPSAPLIAKAHRDWTAFVKAYRREMSKPAAQRLLELLARLSHHAEFSVGCYCEDESRCHRSILRQLLAENDARLS
ncbi:MAG TPA: DUF488 family protein [Burkholderiales bacterium]